MVNNLIIWMLYFTVVIYNTADTLQTIVLIEFGVSEANPIINAIAEQTGMVWAIVLFKLLWIIPLGVCLFAYTGQNTQDGV
jgi:hypothetical protein